MIHYALRCDRGHRFESWFRSASAFEALEEAGHLSCAECGSVKIAKAPMAPTVATTRERATDGGLTAPRSEAEAALAELRRKVEENADYVGGRFAEEARAMHLGSRPERAIYGEANRDEARALIEEGVPIAPLPFLPVRKSN